MDSEIGKTIRQLRIRTIKKLHIYDSFKEEIF